MSALFITLLWTIVGAAIFALMAFLWTECRRRDELDRRAKREIERATRYAETHPIVGRRAA